MLATVARFDPVKGLDVLLRALPGLAARAPAAQLLIVGDGPERERLHALAREVDPGGRVVFAGAVPDAARLLPLVDLYVTASRREGLPLAVLEAMACGLPVLATRVPGHIDAVEDGVTGRARAGRTTPSGWPPRPPGSWPTPRAAPRWAGRRASGSRSASTAPA